MRNKEIILLIVFFINETHSNELIKPNYGRNNFPKVRDNVRDSFKQLVKSVIEFFNVSIGQLEARRRKIKKGFFNFIDVSFKDKQVTDGNSRRFLNHFVNVETELSTLILSHGYKIESHSVITIDGYILTLHKIKPKIDNLTKTRKTIALLQHGLFGSSADWFLLGPEKSLPYIILRSGCEVWLANSRGNIFSKSHVSKNVESPDFWNFSLHEIGMYDLSATVDYILDVSQKDSELIIIGHSSGGAALLVLLSAAPRYNSILKFGVLLAPLVFVSHAKGSLKYVSYLYNEQNKAIFTKNGTKEFVLNGTAYQRVMNIFCDMHSFKSYFTCLRYGGKGEIKPHTSAILSATSSGGSEKCLIHYLQMMKSGHFRKFDYGRKENLRKYGQRFPPRYNLQDVTAPIFLLTSSDDWLSVPEDITMLIGKLPNVIDHILITQKGFSHMHFLIDEYAVQLVYNKIFRL